MWQHQNSVLPGVDSKLYLNVATKGFLGPWQYGGFVLFFGCHSVAKYIFGFVMWCPSLEQTVCVTRSSTGTDYFELCMCFLQTTFQKLRLILLT